MVELSSVCRQSEVDAPQQNSDADWENSDHQNFAAEHQNSCNLPHHGDKLGNAS